jgi:hypothetical protein
MAERDELVSVLSFAGLKLLPSLVLGIVIPAFFNWLMISWWKMQIIGFSSSESDDYLTTFILVLIFPWVVRSNTATMFSSFGTWHLLRLVPWISRHVQGTVTDFEYFRETSVVEWQIYSYYAPTFIATLFHTIRSNLAYSTLGFATLYAAWSMLSRPQKMFLGKTSFKVFAAFILYDFNVRGLFLFLYDATGRSFDRWEIRIAQQNGGTDNQDLPLC